MGRDIWIGIACFVAFLLTFIVVLTGPMFLSDKISDDTIRLPLLTITGVMGLLASLALVSVTFSLAGLSDKSQPLGLPEGSVRAVIALSLIVIFAVTSIYLHNSLAARGLQVSPPMTEQDVQKLTAALRADEIVRVEEVRRPPLVGPSSPPPPVPPPPPDAAGKVTPPPPPPPGTTDRLFVVWYRLGGQATEDFAKQVFTLVGTLMTAVASFYFASRAVTSTQQDGRSTPSITSLDPNRGPAGKMVDLRVLGNALQLAQSLKLAGGGKEVAASNLTSNDLLIQCKVDLKDAAPGAYDVVVTNSDGGSTKVPGGFTVDAPASPTPPSQPIISSIDPKSGLAGTTVGVRIAGSVLQLANSAKLVRADKEVLASGLTSNETEIRCTFDLTGVPQGPYDVVVTNPDGGTAKLSGEFTVT